jgi:hypothetical protein
MASDEWGWRNVRYPTAERSAAFGVDTPGGLIGPPSDRPVSDPGAGEPRIADPGNPGRYFVAIATAHYDDPGFGSLPVDKEIAQLKAWLCDAERLGDRAFTVPGGLSALAHDPDEDQIRAALRGPAKPWVPQDAAVVFVTGHGAMADDDHWTVLKASSSEDLPTTALRTADLARWLKATKIENLLLIIDTCFAGAIVKKIFTWDLPMPDSWLVLPSAREDQTAILGGLTSAIGRAVEKLRGEEGQKYGTVARYFTPADFIDTVKSYLGPRQTLDQQFRGLLRKPHVCLPNPHYASSATVPTQPARHELALPKQDLETHWGPRARGVAAPKTPGWLFTGRAGLMRALLETIREAPRTVLVTGGAGCGKSAVLARMVTLCDPDFLAAYPVAVADVPPDLLPEPKAINVAVLASRKWPNEILGQLLEALDVPHPRTTAWEAARLEDRIRVWTDWLHTREEPVTIVLDALDEAQDPGAVVDLLAALTLGKNANKVRLLVGVRSAGGSDDPLGASENDYSRPLVDDAEIKLHAQRLRVDDDPWWHEDDVRAYSASILRNTPGSPYAKPLPPEVADGIARAITQRTGRSFLIARITATSLAGRDEILDPADETWLAALEAGVLGVFRDDLWQTFPRDQSRREDTVTLLRAVAYAYGRGLPWGDIWPTVANILAGRPNKYGDRDIVGLLDSRMNAYLISDQEDRVTVYRLFHEVLRTTLREDWKQLLADPRSRAEFSG